jgi:hypothetical protein
MSRGRKPLMALREAVLIAKKRGEVRQFMHEPGRICDFVIYCLGFTAFVRIRRVTRVHCSQAWIEWEAADALATLRAIAPGTGISRELWVFLPRGTFRFFRVEETGLVELSRDGTVMAPKTWAGVLAQQAAAARPVAADGTAAIPPVQAPPSGVSSKNCPGQFFSSSRSEDLSHIGENPHEGGKGGP